VLKRVDRVGVEVCAARDGDLGAGGFGPGNHGISAAKSAASSGTVRTGTGEFGSVLFDRYIRPVDALEHSSSKDLGL
jgi:hypothetical protein